MREFSALEPAVHQPVASLALVAAVPSGTRSSGGLLQMLDGPGGGRTASV